MNGEGFPVPGFTGRTAFLTRRTGFFEQRQRRKKRFPESAVCERAPAGGVDTILPALYIQNSQTRDMSQIRIQVGQLWKKDATGDIYLVTRLYSEALSTMAVLRKSGAEGEAQVRVRVERGSKGQTMQGFSPAQEEESY
jgi:hypothetical protein